MQYPFDNRMTIGEFLPMLAQSEVRLELINGVVYAQAGGTIAHAKLADTVFSLLRAASKAPCTAYSSIMSVTIDALESHVFPDASYSCEKTSPRAPTLTAPKLVVEVISPESLRRDRVDKLDAYKSVPSIVEYLLVDSRRPWLALHRRNPDNTWTESLYESGAKVALGAIDLTIDVDALYAGVL